MSRVVAKFSIPGEPVSKARARFTNYGSKTRAYTPDKTREAEKKFAAAYLAIAEPATDPDVAFGVRVEFHHETGQRRDVDNMLKAILDGLNKIAWPDDVQVTRLEGVKKRVPKGEAQTIVTILTLGRIDKPRGICIGCGAEFAQFTSTAARKYCTRRCGYDHAKRIRTKPCLNCGSDFLPHDIASLYCDQTCMSQHKRVTLTCTHCQDEYTVPRSLANKGKTCSPECGAARARLNRKSTPKKVCPDCGGPVSKPTYTRCRACNVAAGGRWAEQHIRKGDAA